MKKLLSIFVDFTKAFNTAPHAFKPEQGYPLTATLKFF